MQQIHNIEIKNFKSIRHAEIKDCRKINVLVGPPNVGKSNILEAVGLFSILQIAKSEYFRLNEICRLKHFSELFLNKNYRGGALISLNKEVEVKLNLNNASNLQIDFDGISHTDEHFNIGIIEKSLNQKVNVSSSFDISYSKMDYDIDSYPIYPIRKYAFNNNVVVGVNGGLSLNIPFGTNLLDVLQRESQLRKDLSEILKAYSLKLLLDEESKEIMLIKELDESVVNRIGYYLIADTLKRLVFYKAAIFSNQKSILLFEEPEAHCYEPYIMELTNAIKNDESNQFFIVTHSQYVIDELLRDKDSRDNVNIYLVGLDYNNETKVKLLKPEISEDVYKSGLNVFFNFKSLWDEN